MTAFFGDALVQMAERVADRNGFATFTEELADNLRSHPEEWDNAQLSEFLMALAAYTRDMPGFQANLGGKSDSISPSWRTIAEILLAARVYE